MAQYTEEKTEALAISLMEAAQEYGLMGVAGRCPHELAHRAVRPGARIRQPRTVNNVSGGGRGKTSLPGRTSSQPDRSLQTAPAAH